MIVKKPRRPSLMARIAGDQQPPAPRRPSRGGHMTNHTEDSGREALAGHACARSQCSVAPKGHGNHRYGQADLTMRQSALDGGVFEPEDLRRETATPGVAEDRPHRAPRLPLGDDLRNLLLEGHRHRELALEHLRRRGFGDIAEEAVTNALHVLVVKVHDPLFAPPEKPVAWLMRRSVLEAYTLRRENPSLVWGTPELDQLVDFVENVTCGDLAHTGLADEHADDPERNLRAEVEARAAEHWRERVLAALGELPAQDVATLHAEIERGEAGATATPAHRKRLERARVRARRALAQYGINSATIPDDLPPDTVVALLKR